MALSGSPSTSVVTAAQAAYVSSTDAAHPTSNTAAVVTYAALPGFFHVLGQIFGSLDAAPASGVNLKVEDVSGTTIFSVDVRSDYRLYGAVLGQAISDVAKFSPYLSSSRALTVVFGWYGTNDIYLYGLTAAQVYANYKLWVAAVRAAAVSAGCTVKIVAETCLPRSNTYTVRNTLNALWRADFNVSTAYTGIFGPAAGIVAAGGADCLCDVASNANIGQDGDQNDTTYYAADAIHLNDTGCAVEAVYRQHALNYLGIT